MLSRQLAFRNDLMSKRSGVQGLTGDRVPMELTGTLVEVILAAETLTWLLIGLALISAAGSYGSWNLVPNCRTLSA